MSNTENDHERMAQSEQPVIQTCFFLVGVHSNSENIEGFVHVSQFTVISYDLLIVALVLPYINHSWPQVQLKVGYQNHPTPIKDVWNWNMFPATP